VQLRTDFPSASIAAALGVHIRLSSYYLTRTSYLAHAVMKTKSFVEFTRKLGRTKGDKPTDDRTQPSGTSASSPATVHIYEKPSPSVPTFNSAPTTVFATSALQRRAPLLVNKPPLRRLELPAAAHPYPHSIRHQPLCMLPESRARTALAGLIVLSKANLSSL
jgi:hypothetical protein